MEQYCLGLYVGRVLKLRESTNCELSFYCVRNYILFIAYLTSLVRSKCMQSINSQFCLQMTKPNHATEHCKFGQVDSKQTLKQILDAIRDKVCVYIKEICTTARKG